MRQSGVPKRTYSVLDVNAILRVGEAVREIRREYPEHSKMRVFRVVDGVLLYTFKVLRGDRLQFVAREPAPRQMLKEVAELSKKQGATATKGKGSCPAPSYGRGRSRVGPSAPSL